MSGSCFGLFLGGRTSLVSGAWGSEKSAKGRSSDLGTLGPLRVRWRNQILVSNLFWGRNSLYGVSAERKTRVFGVKTPKII